MSFAMFTPDINQVSQLGFMAPDGTTNLAVEDIINAIDFLHKVVPYFGGSPSMITLAGQSSGANMIRALLAVPSVSSLFRSAILQSDVMVSLHFWQVADFFLNAIPGLWFLIHRRPTNTPKQFQ